MTNKTPAIINSRWIKLPPTPDTNPKSHNTTTTARIVHNMIEPPLLITKNYFDCAINQVSGVYQIETAAAVI
jgi:hypothetical protein